MKKEKKQSNTINNLAVDLFKDKLSESSMLLALALANTIIVYLSENFNVWFYTLSTIITPCFLYSFILVVSERIKQSQKINKIKNKLKKININEKLIINIFLKSNNSICTYNFIRKSFLIERDIKDEERPNNLRRGQIWNKSEALQCEDENLELAIYSLLDKQLIIKHGNKDFNVWNQSFKIDNDIKKGLIYVKRK